MRKLLLLLALCTACASHAISEHGAVTVHTFTRDFTSAHLLVAGKKLVLVDAGYDKNAVALAKDIVAAGFDPKDIAAIILTHGHGDHAGGAVYFHQTYGTRIVAGAGDREMLAAGRMDTLCSNGFLGKSRHSTDQNLVYPGQSADLWIDAPTPLDPIAGIDGIILPIPGHTKGSLAVLVGDMAFVGDLFRGALVGSSAEIHLHMCDLAGNRRDIAGLLDGPARGAAIFYVGHFGPVSRAAVSDRFVNE